MLEAKFRSEVASNLAVILSKNLVPTLLLVLLVFKCSLVAAAEPAKRTTPDVHEVARRVDRNYNNLGTLRADFEERYQGAGISRVESGVLWLKRPGKMRWDYLSPKQKVFIANGKDAFFYVKGEPQARKAKLEKMDDLRSPLRYLLGKTKLEKEFDDLILLTPAADTASFVLQGVPKMMKERVERVQLEITPGYEIARILIEEIGGAVTEFRFSNPAENTVVPDDKFRFTVPEGVHIIDTVEPAS